MYEIDDRDRVRRLPDVLRPDVGAPLPVVLATEGDLHLVYRVNDPDPNWSGTTVREVSPTSFGERLAVIRFPGATTYFGPPNDEAFQGHPLYARGLRPYGAWEVENSSWIRLLERMNSVHPSHRPEHYEAHRHFIFSFHDTTFECVAFSFDWQIENGSVKSILESLIAAWV